MRTICLCEFLLFVLFFCQEGSGACQHPDLLSLTSNFLSIGAGKKSQENSHYF